MVKQIMFRDDLGINVKIVRNHGPSLPISYYGNRLIVKEAFCVSSSMDSLPTTGTGSL
jgi:hypothetical protein